MRDRHTVEVTFEWPRCADPASIQAGWEGASQRKDGSWVVDFSLQELRRAHGIPACTGPVERQSRRVDLHTLLRPEMRFGKLRMNAERLYGFQKKLPERVVAFDLR